MIDLQRVRAETPGCPRVLHLNNAGAALMPQPVLDAQLTYLRQEAEGGGYETAHDRADDLEQVYASVARLIGCAPDEVALVDSATRAWDAVFYSLPFQPRQRILTHRASYASNYLAMLQVARRTGVTIEVVPSDATGALDVDALAERLDDDVALVALTHMPTNGGLVNPAAEVGRLTRPAGIPFLLDACQTAGQLPLDVEALGCDFLSATGRKYLRGPRGTGFLYVGRQRLAAIEPHVIDLHAATWTSADGYTLRDDARRFEAWEANLAARLGLGVAVDYALGLGLDAVWERVQPLAGWLRRRLAALPGVTVHDQGAVQGGIVTFSSRRHGAEHLQAALRRRDVNVSVSSPASTRLDAEARALPDMVRASVHYYNTEEEIDRFCAHLLELTST